jgi:hypothetical protein
MTTTNLAILAFLGAALVGLIIAWYWARTLRERFEAEARSHGAALRLELSPGHGASLRGLTSEPILLKQSADGVRVQIDDRPMLPLAAFLAGDASAALREASVRVAQEYGQSWTVLLTVHGDESVTVQRLA